MGLITDVLNRGISVAFKWRFGGPKPAPKVCKRCAQQKKDHDSYLHVFEEKEG